MAFFELVFSSWSFKWVLYEERAAALVSVPQCVPPNASFFLFFWLLLEKQSILLLSSDKAHIENSKKHSHY